MVAVPLPSFPNTQLPGITASAVGFPYVGRATRLLMASCAPLIDALLLILLLIPPRYNQYLGLN
jgi:hypothetical protein